MAPKRGTRQLKTQANPTKRPRLDAEPPAARKEVVVLLDQMRKEVMEDIYSPNVDTSDVTEDEEETRVVGSGKSARELRAERRAAEYVLGEDVTDDEEEDEDEDDDDDDGVGVFAKVARVVDVGDGDSNVDAEGEEIEEEGFPIAAAAVVGSREDPGKAFLDGFMPDADVEDIYEQPAGNANADPIENAGFERERGGHEYLRSLRELYPAAIDGTHDLDLAGFEEPRSAMPPPSAAETRYRELVAQRIRDSQASPFGVRFPAARRSSTDRLFSESSWSSPSSSSASGEEEDDDEYEYDYSEPWPEPRDDVHNQTLNHGDKNNDNNDNKGETSKTEDKDKDKDKDTYIVNRRDKLLDSFLSGQLRRIARALNFMVRARASGIEVGDFDALAAVEPERWATLIGSPDDAAELMVETMLEIPFWDVLILSNRATALIDELGTLGIVI
ncbi:hypothetical protein F5B18DRAFT_639335 [Nemania serpens]|nr:hypothetical protein F5B18DRAFT_639335 [Nemania serpens]